MPSQKFGLAITAVVVAVGAVVGGVILFSSSKASEVNLTTAGLVPEDAGFYFALNTDLTSSQWVSTFKLVERLGTEDPEGELKEGAEEGGGIDWEEDVVPFLGGNAAVFVRGISISDISAEGAVIIRCTDAEKALEVLDEQAGLGPDHEYGGIEYYEGGPGGWVAIIEDHLVIAFDEDSLQSVIDVHNGDLGSLSDVDDFQTLRDELTGNFIAFAYVSTQNMLGDFLLDDPVVKAAIDNSGAGDLVFQPAAWVVGAKEDGFEFQAASLGKSGVVSPMLAPRESALIKYVPADAPVFFSTIDIAETWDKIMAQARPEIDEAIRAEGEYDSLDDLLKDAGSELGIGSLEEVIRLLDGETAFAMWFPDGTEDNPEGLMIAEVDQAKAEPLMKTIASNANGGSRTEKMDGTDVTIFVGDDGEDLAFAFFEGNLLFGTIEGLRLVLENDDPTLDELRRYRETVDQMPTKLGTYAYLDLSKLLRLAEGGIPADLDEVERALAGLIINGVDERGVLRLSGILTIEE